jgi:hypothetical protein
MAMLLNTFPAPSTGGMDMVYQQLKDMLIVVAVQ